jgi:endogenous inhibitor of DNA gyrase (YacG/DUF329 family)
MIFFPIMTKNVRCPTCGNLTNFDSTNRFRPFCSGRCQILDLGAWADEKYAIPSEVSENSSVNEKREDHAEDRTESFAPPPKHHLN